MILHIWMHWFWITSFAARGLLLLVLKHLMCSQSFVAEAGLLGTSFTLDSCLSERLLNVKGSASQNKVVGDPKERGRRNVENEGSPGTEPEASFLPPRENKTVSPAGDGTASNDDKGSVYRGVTSSDVEDTYSGGNLDGFQYPLKKYSKYATYAKYKAKPKNGEDERDAPKVPQEKSDGAVKGAPSENGNGTGGAGQPPHSNGTQTTLGTTLPGGVNVTEKPEVVAGSSLASNETELPNGTVAVDGRVNASGNGDSVGGEKRNLSRSTADVTEEDMPSVGEPKEMSLNIENKVDDTSARTTVEPFFFNNRVAAATSSESRKRLSQPALDAGSITGITLGIIVVTCFVGAISFLLYRRRYLNKPQALNDKCSNLDSSGYIDDTSLRENSEEMYSLDNDSFLNSLEAMTIQNYWTENVKHTKL